MTFTIEVRFDGQPLKDGAYNAISVEKELHLQLDMGHGASDEFNSLFDRRILAAAGVE